LLFWTLDPERLSVKARQAIQQSDRILISSMSVWELALKVKRRKLVLPLTIPDYVDCLLRLEGLEILAVDVQTWLGNLDLAWEHRDPADRTIVALAGRFKCPLVTSDGIIGEYYPQTVW
jgi:PIN domain nuclease of toxin-antitoxin system